MLYRKVIAVCLGILRKLFSLLKQVVFRIRYLGVRGLGLRSRYMATGWTVWGIDPGGGEIFSTRPDPPWVPPSLLYNGYRVFPEGKAAGAWRWPPTPSSADDK